MLGRLGWLAIHSPTRSLNQGRPGARSPLNKGLTLGTRDFIEQNFHTTSVLYNPSLPRASLLRPLPFACIRFHSRYNLVYQPRRFVSP